MTKPVMFQTTVLGVGPYCVEFPDGEIITTRSKKRQELIAAICETEELSDRIDRCTMQQEEL